MSLVKIGNLTFFKILLLLSRSSSGDRKKKKKSSLVEEIINGVDMAVLQEDRWFQDNIGFVEEN
jgi:hypothetical protein